MKKHILWGLAAAALVFASGANGQTATVPVSLSFLKFTVSDLPKMQAFYQKAFGMQLKKHLDYPGNTEVILSSPNGLDLALVNYKDKRAVTLGTANGPIGFYLKDVDSVYKSAIAAGATGRSGPSAIAGGRVAVVTDPEGHDIELLHLD